MTTSLLDVQLGQRFSFEVYPAAVLGNNFRDVRMEAMLNARTAASFGVDIQALHANVYPTLPEGSTPNDALQYNYIRVQYQSGEYAVIGVPWIRPESIVISAGGKLVLTFMDKTQTDIDRIMLALSSNGYRPDDIQTLAS